MRRSLRGLTLLLVIIAVLIGLGIAFIYSGIYNVAATYPDPGIVNWVFSTAMDNSVKHHAAGIKVPKLDSPDQFREGFREYRELCVQCHGAPGVDMGNVGKGLNPDPPELVEAAGDWQPNELFRITKNGVRMTGMPAWGVTESDEDIWAMVAFMRRLPKMQPAEYQALDRQNPPSHEEY